MGRKTLTIRLKQWKEWDEHGLWLVTDAPRIPRFRPLRVLIFGVN